MSLNGITTNRELIGLPTKAISLPALVRKSMYTMSPVTTSDAAGQRKPPIDLHHHGSNWR